MVGAGGLEFEVIPLTKVTEEGEVYCRRPEVQAQLEELCRQPENEFLARLDVPNREDERYLFDETLVYFLREARRNGDDLKEDQIYRRLAIRAEKVIRKHAFQVEGVEYSDFLNDLHLKILEKLLDVDSDKGDYAQVNFGEYVSLLAKDKKQKTWNRRKNQPHILEIDAPNEDGHDLDPADTRLSHEEITVLSSALEKLPENTATAFVMHYLDGIQISSNDPDTPTVARYFGVSARTIRNWFANALRCLVENEEER